MIWQVPGKKLAYRKSDQGGMEYSDDDGQTWYLTFRTLSEIIEMHPTIVGPSVEDAERAEMAEREIFGETLDEEIPEDLWEMIGGTI